MPEMSTHACFERHLALARRHEDCARMAAEDGAALRLRGVAADLGGSELPRAAKAARCAQAQQRLAVREFKEAARLRPRNVDVKQHFRQARAGLKRLETALEAPKPKPLGRFLSHFNLSIRYWDLGKAQQALEEARAAFDELHKAGLPCGCAEHSLDLMERMSRASAAKERELLEAQQRAPEAIMPNYELGVHFFDKRMILRAETQLRATRERVKAASSLKVVKLERQKQRQLEEERQKPWLLSQPATIAWGPTDSPAAVHAEESKKARRLKDLLEDIEDDLCVLGKCRQVWCVEEEAGKAGELQATGVRDGTRKQLLPCLRRRFFPQETHPQETRECDAWWAELCRRTDVDIHSAPVTPSPAARRH